MIDFDIYVDSDGTIADLEAYIVKALGKRIADFQPKGRFWQAFTWHDKHVEKIFRNLPKMEDADVLMDFLRSNYVSVKILTACGTTPSDAAQQKVEWFAEHYPGVECIVVTKSPDKAQYAHPRAVLIDDRAKSIDPWVAAGGIGILHTSAEDTILQLSKLSLS